jgi:hypothetical protein
VLEYSFQLAQRPGTDLVQFMKRSRSGKSKVTPIVGVHAFCVLQSISGDETVNVNKPSPVSPQLTARSGQSAHLV